MRRKTKVAIVGTAAGSTLLIGLGLATTASAGESGWGGEVCASSSAGMPTMSGVPTGMPSGGPTVSMSGMPTDMPTGDPTMSGVPTGVPSGDPTMSGMPTGQPSASDATTKSNTKSNKTKRGWWNWFHRGNGGNCNPTSDPTSSGQQPSDPGTPSATATSEPTATATSEPTATATATATATPTATSSCTTATGDAATIVSPGAGTVTVTIKVCDGVLTTSTGTVANGNWDANTPALASLDTLAVQYYASDMSKLTYSGATLTSNSYQTSLQSALSKAGL